MQQTRTTVHINTLNDEVTQKYKNAIANIFQAFQKNKNYYDRKASAQPLKVGGYVFLLNPKYHTQSDKMQVKTFLWNGPYKVTKTLTHSNYFIRKTCTHKTQYLQRMWLRRFIQQHIVPDIQVNDQQLYQDPDTIDELDLFSTNIPAYTPCQD